MELRRRLGGGAPSGCPTRRRCATATAVVPWAEFDRRADGVAAALLGAGLEQQDKVAQYLYNGPEYLESVFASFKAGLVPVNTNYRYADDELVYLWDNADVRAVSFHGAFTETIERIRDRVPGVRLWLWVDDGSGPRPDWAGRPRGGGDRAAPVARSRPWGRSGDDLYLLYTGGTTGMPQGRDVAPGRPLRRAEPERQGALPDRRVARHGGRDARAAGTAAACRPAR